MSALLRPNTIAIDRRSAGAATQTGSRPATVTRLNAGIPALIDVKFRVAGTASFEVEGLTYVQDMALFMDGLQPWQFPGLAPGQTIVVSGVTYTVAANGLGAYPDLARNDRITDEHGQTYLVLAAMFFYNVVPVVEAALAIGRAWAG